MAQTLKTDTIFTAVGLANFQKLKSVFINIIRMRYAFRIESPLNIIACENFPISRDPLASFRYELRRDLDDPDIQVYFDEDIGLIPAIDEAVVPEISVADFKNPIIVEPEAPPLIIDLNPTFAVRR